MDAKLIMNKELVISLIKDDLRNMRLTYGLSELGLVAEKYSLQLNRAILLLMGFDNAQCDDDIYDKYNSYSEKIIRVDIFDKPELLNELASDIYNLLLKEIKLRKPKIRIVEK